MTRYTKAERHMASGILAVWRTLTPAPAETMTAHEAYSLTWGALGEYADHESPVRRIDAALALAHADRIGALDVAAAGPGLDTAADETLGSCGCRDYHAADCPTRTGYADTMSRYEAEIDADEAWR